MLAQAAMPDKSDRCWPKSATSGKSGLCSPPAATPGKSAQSNDSALTHLRSICRARLMPFMGLQPAQRGNGGRRHSQSGGLCPQYSRAKSDGLNAGCLGLANFLF